VTIRIPGNDRLREIEEAFRRQARADDPRTLATQIIQRPECECLSEELLRALNEYLPQKFRIARPPIIVGSAKLGFSLKEIATTGLFRGFQKDSDIDVAIVDSGLFDRIWEAAYESFCAQNPWANRRDYQHYFFRGWIRPDMLPRSLAARNEWFDAAADVTRDVFGSRHKATAGLYKSENFLLGYQEDSIRRAVSRLELGP
jgi:hypothetical protein